MSELFDLIAPMKALTLWQPWASLVAAGVKRHETRHWSTSYRGMIAIHAAKTIDVAGAPDDLCESALGMNWSRLVPIGVVVAIARLTDCITCDAFDCGEQNTTADLAAGNFGPSRFAWRLEDVRSVRRPIPLIGRQGLFNWKPPADLADCVGPTLDHAAICRAIGWP